MQTISPVRLAFIGLCGLALLVLIAALIFVFLDGRSVGEVELTAASSGLPTATSDGNIAITAGKGPAAGAPASSAKEQLPGTEGSVSEVIRVYVAGAVQRPDVYSLRAGDRLVDALAAAGGPTSAADLESVNLAARVEDEGYYYIPELRESGPGELTQPPTPNIAADPMTGRAASDVERRETPADGPALPVNINTADEARLETLPGIGPARAAAIIAYREEHGSFVSVEELTAVSGIGQGILENVRAMVTVGK